MFIPFTLFLDARHEQMSASNASKNSGGVTLDPPAKKPKSSAKVAGASSASNVVSKKQGSSQGVRWVFTLRAKDRSPQDLKGILKGIAKEWFFQKEQGAGNNAYEHYQGVFALNMPKQVLSTVKNLLGFNDVHLETCRDWVAAKAYSQKDDTRIDGPWTSSGSKLNPQFQLQRAKFHLWQVQALGWVTAEPDNRHITWVIDKKGGAGKSMFVNYCIDNLDAVAFNNGKESDIAYCYEEQSIVLFDLPRAKAHVNYVTMEDMKNGRLFSGKYESKNKRFNPPHVVVFANWLPDFDKMSLDRWKIYNLENKTMTREREFTVPFGDDGKEKKYVLE